MVRGLQGDEKIHQTPQSGRGTTPFNGGICQQRHAGTRAKAGRGSPWLRHVRSTRARSGGVLSRGECLRATRFALGETASGRADRPTARPRARGAWCSAWQRGLHSRERLDPPSRQLSAAVSRGADCAGAPLVTGTPARPPPSQPNPKLACAPAEQFKAPAVSRAAQSCDLAVFFSCSVPAEIPDVLARGSNPDRVATRHVQTHET